MYQKLKDLKEVLNQANYLRAKCLIKSVLTALIMLSGQIISPLFAQTTIRYGDNLMDAIVCGTTDTFTFKGKSGDLVVIQVVELGDFGGVCGAACFCFDQHIELMDSTNHVLAVSSSPDGNNTQNRFRTKIGPTILPLNSTYKIAIRDSHNNGRGEYAIFMQRINSPERANSITAGQILLVSLNRGEVNTYEFEALPLDRAVIEMTPGSIGNISPILELYDQQGHAVVLPGSGCVEYVFKSKGTFRLLAYSKADESGTYNLNLNVTMVPNRPPLAVEDHAITDKNTQVAIDVLANDSDADRNTLRIASVTQGTNGSVISNGSYVIYTPREGFTGTDEFTYKVTDLRDTSTAKVIVIVSSITGDKPASELFVGFVLNNNYPNPFSQVTRISYVLPRAANVHITIYNMFGQIMEMLVNDYMMSGVHEVIFNATGLNAGIYEYVMEAEGFRATKRMILLK